MRIELTKAYKVDFRKLPKGTQMRVSNEKGRMLIKKKVAKQLDVPTTEEETEQKLQAAADAVD